jgi:hypothetical protein
MLMESAPVSRPTGAGEKEDERVGDMKRTSNAGDLRE